MLPRPVGGSGSGEQDRAAVGSGGRGTILSGGVLLVEVPSNSGGGGGTPFPIDASVGHPASVLQKSISATASSRLSLSLS